MVREEQSENESVVHTILSITTSSKKQNEESPIMISFNSVRSGNQSIFESYS